MLLLLQQLGGSHATSGQGSGGPCGRRLSTAAGWKACLLSEAWRRDQDKLSLQITPTWLQAAASPDIASNCRGPLGLHSRMIQPTRRPRRPPGQLGEFLWDHPTEHSQEKSAAYNAFPSSPNTRTQNQLQIPHNSSMS